MSTIEYIEQIKRELGLGMPITPEEPARKSSHAKDPQTETKTPPQPTIIMKKGKLKKP